MAPTPDYESIEFYDALRDCVSRMTLVAKLAEGDLYYYEHAHLGYLWLVVGEDSLIAAHSIGEDLYQISRTVTIWHRAMLGRRVLWPANEGMVAYAAQRDSNMGELRIAWAEDGDWVGYVSRRPLAAKRWLLPVGWPETWRGNIAEFCNDRRDGYYLEGNPIWDFMEQWGLAPSEVVYLNAPRFATRRRLPSISTSRIRVPGNEGWIDADALDRSILLAALLGQVNGGGVHVGAQGDWLSLDTTTLGGSGAGWPDGSIEQYMGVLSGRGYREYPPLTRRRELKPGGDDGIGWELTDFLLQGLSHWWSGPQYDDGRGNMVADGLCRFGRIDAPCTQVEQALLERGLLIAEPDRPQTARPLRLSEAAKRGRCDETSAFVQGLFDDFRARSPELWQRLSDDVGALDGISRTFTDDLVSADALPVFENALAVFESALGSSHPRTMRARLSLGALLHDRGQFEDAEPLYRESVADYEEWLGQNHVAVGHAVMCLGLLCLDEGRLEEAEPLLERSLAVQERADHHRIADSLHGLAELRRAQGRDNDAAALDARAPLGSES